MMNQLKTIALLGALSAMLVGIGSVVAPGSLTIFFVLAVALNVGAYFFSDRLVLAMHRARPLSREDAPELHAMTEELASRAGIPMPRLYVIPEAGANAFATGRNPAHGVVAVTEGIVRVLPPRELKGVIAHEIAHIRHRDILLSTIAATLAATISYIGQALQFTALFGGGRDDEEHGSAAGSLAVALVAPLAATLVQLAISRSREYAADERAAQLTGDPLSLAGALERLSAASQMLPVATAPATASLFIVNPFAGGGRLLQLFSTHPPMAERVRRLRQLGALLGQRAA